MGGKAFRANVRLSVGLALLAILWLASDGGERSEARAAREAARADAASLAPVAVLELGDLGAVRIELLPDAAPRAVGSFVARAESGAYDGLALRRTAAAPVIRVGEKDTAEHHADRRAEHDADAARTDAASDAKHTRGVVSMATSGEDDAGGGPFLVVLGEAPDLDARHTVFGRVVEGLDLLDRIAAPDSAAPGQAERPAAGVVIESIRIERPAGHLAPGEAPIQERTPNRERLRMRLC